MLKGMRFGSLMVAASAKVPARISGSANEAVFDARIMSNERASSNPPPTAMPLTAAMAGLSSPGSSCTVETFRLIRHLCAPRMIA